MKQQKVKGTRSEKIVIEPVRGRAKSGRVWKEENKRFSNLTLQAPQRTKWEKKLALKNEKKMVKKREEEIQNDRKQAKQALRDRQKLNEERRLENERKAEIVQVIKDPRKIKKLKKKQLRHFEKRDLSKIKTV